MLKTLLLTLTILLFSAVTAWAALNINTAGQEQLQALPGIGPAKAAAIIEYRTANGPFNSVDDLAKVKGIGAKTLDGLRNDLSVADQ
ncbi:ComEA family DNA-binding protein [Desulfurivibrio sp. D14AmB]|uniref:ComEA family DNA-binding protein n=1 Tax=Desulfurivibrio sp. D14AmB TaxID=3374370 RepID=UPI00376EADD2